MPHVRGKIRTKYSLEVVELSANLELTTLIMMLRLYTDYKFEAKCFTRLVYYLRRRHRAEPAGMSQEPQTQLGTVRPIVVDITAVTDANPNVTVVAEYEQGEYEGKPGTLCLFLKFLEDLLWDH